VRRAVLLEFRLQPEWRLRCVRFEDLTWPDPRRREGSICLER
jgi:hypothetical protein